MLEMVGATPSRESQGMYEVGKAAPTSPIYKVEEVSPLRLTPPPEQPGNSTAHTKKAGRQAGRSPPRGSCISCSLWCLHRLSACPLLQVGFGLGHLPPSGPDQYGYCILLPKPSGVTQLS